MTVFSHPVTGTVYETTDEGLVVVRDAQGSEGLFRSDGRWVSGDLKYADAHSCGFVSRRIPGQP